MTYSEAKFQKTMSDIRLYFEDMASRMDAPTVLVSFTDQNNKMSLMSYGLDVEAQFGCLIEASHRACQNGAIAIQDISYSSQFSRYVETAKLAGRNSYVGVPLKNSEDETFGSFALLRSSKDLSADKFSIDEMYEIAWPLLIELISDLDLDSHQPGIPVCLALSPPVKNQNRPPRWETLNWFHYESRIPN